MRIRRLVSTFVLAILAIPATASAGTLHNGGRGFLAANGEANNLVVTFDGSHYTFTDSVPITLAETSTATCTHLTSNSVRCSRDRGSEPPVDRINAGLAYPPMPFPGSPFPSDTAPNTFRYSGPSPGSSTEYDLTVDGGEGNDDLEGGPGDDHIRGWGGVDALAGNDGPDVIRDTCCGKSGTIRGGEGNDELRAIGAGSDDTMFGGPGNDLMITGHGSDKLYGEAGNDILDVSFDSFGDRLEGGPGADGLIEVIAEYDPTCTREPGAADVNDGGPGPDEVIDGCSYGDTFLLKDGERDEWSCEGAYRSAEVDAADVLTVPRSQCAQDPSKGPKCLGTPATKIGTPGRDVIKGTPRPDVIVALGGNDVVRGLGGSDFICGGTGKDRLIGGGRKDWLIGGAGRDTLLGGAGGDSLIGGAGRDKLVGGPGKDRQRQ